MNKKTLLCFLAIFPMCASASSQNVEERILCQGADGTTIVLDLWKPSQFGVALHCLHASFSTEMMACAPHGGWGLGSNDDMAELIDVTNDWLTADGHSAGKVIATAGKRGVYFNAHAGKGISSNLIYRWKFAFDRNSGSATWYGTNGYKVAYDCEVSR